MAFNILAKDHPYNMEVERIDHATFYFIDLKFCKLKT